MTLTKQDVVNRVMEAGKLISAEAAEALRNVSEEDMRRLIDDSDSSMITVEAIRNLSGRNYEILKSVDKSIFTGHAAVSHSYFTSKYEQMKKLISERIAKSYVSLANLGRGESFVIGMVREISEHGIVIEDPTKNLFLKFENTPNCDYDDVIAVRVANEEKEIIGKEIIHPGVPLRTPEIGNGKVALAVECTIERIEADVIFIIGSKAASVGSVINATGSYPTQAERGMLSNPSILKIGGVVVLIADRFSKKWLEKRHLGEPNVGIKEDVLCLDILPDVILYKSDVNETNHYKSITMIGCKPGNAVVIDLADRKEKFIELNSFIGE